jgi:GDP-L-fucose synthase
LFLLKNKKIKNTFVNIGSGEEISIIKLARLIKKVSRFNGKIFFEKNKPSGQKRRILDSSIINSLGWRKKIKLENGIPKLYHDYVKMNNKE